MVNRRYHFSGLFAVLLALMAQLGVGASVPRLDPFALVGASEAICHTTDQTGGPADHAPAHPVDCLFCPFCGAVHAAPAALIATSVELVPPSVVLVRRAGLPPPATAPPTPHRPPSQPRAPPSYS